MGQEPRNRGPAIRALTGAAVLVLLAAGAPAAHAQFRLVSSARTNGSAPAEPAYVDRVIEGLAPDEGKPVEEVVYNREGWPRFLRLETRLGTQPTGDRDRSVGFTAAGAIETPNHGVLSIDANLAVDEKRGVVTLRQHGLPVEGGWEVNNELGVSTPLAPGILRLPSRVFVPFLYMRGATTEWLHPGSRTQLLASTGTPGRLDGYPVSGFRSLAGTISTAGAQHRDGEWSFAVRHAHADGVSRVDAPQRPADYLDADSTHFAVRHEGPGHHVQANLVTARTTDVSRVRNGGWIDGEWKQGTSTYAWGAYRLDPELSWAGQAMASDIEGAFTRGAWRTREWSAEASVDVLRSIEGNDETGILTTASGRWRYSRTLTFGAGATVRRYKGNAGSAFADMRWRNDWGSTGLRGERLDTFGLRSSRLVIDHNWQLPLGWALQTSLSGGRESGADAAGSLWGAAVSFTAPIGDNATIGGNASTERYGGGNRLTSANLNLVWKLDARWSVEGNFIVSRGKVEQVLPLDPLAPAPERLFLQNDTNSVFLVLRYEDRAGTRSAPLGGSPRTGGGGIEGVVFLDANRSGEQEAGETGASGVTVYLDGRYAVRTDSQGRFSFPFVAPGLRVITVLNETLPLPWETGERAETRIEVIVRETARISIPVIRRGPE